MNATMRYAPLFVALSVFLIGCSRNDVALRKTLSGKWLATNGVVSIDPDGGFASTFTGRQVWSYKGTWQLEGSLLYVTTTMSNSVLCSNVMQARIIRANERELVYALPDQTVFLSRQP